MKTLVAFALSLTLIASGSAWAGNGGITGVGGGTFIVAYDCEGASTRFTELARKIADNHPMSPEELDEYLYYVGVCGFAGDLAPMPSL